MNRQEKEYESSDDESPEAYSTKQVNQMMILEQKNRTIHDKQYRTFTLSFSIHIQKAIGIKGKKKKRTFEKYSAKEIT